MTPLKKLTSKNARLCKETIDYCNKKSKLQTSVVDDDPNYSCILHLLTEDSNGVEESYLINFYRDEIEFEFDRSQRVVFLQPNKGYEDILQTIIKKIETVLSGKQLLWIDKIPLIIDAEEYLNS